MNWNWNETIINLQYSYENLKQLLNDFCENKSKYTQFEMVR
ncbi:hypothetical protein ABID52_001784 [Fictibacillus halophilus]|uniref:Uncharacterized protein n=1 Tax=Fictibacillus halophilus TaxID=1610490 RepID=A0ABV2LHZ7_9BACL|nr:hypothetical protein [Fictibacillus halophilus]